jgi:hypothetical protein
MRRDMQIHIVAQSLIIKAALPQHKPGAAIVDHKGAVLRSLAGYGKTKAATTSTVQTARRHGR